MALAAAASVFVAFFLDAAFAEPPARAHPVAWFGRRVALADRAWPHPRLVGAAVALCLPLGVALVAGGTVAFAGRVAPTGPLGTVALTALAGLWLFVASSRRMLRDAARDVLAAVERDPDAARTAIRALVGRDASALSPGELRSAAVESAAENLADGLVAPLLAFALGAQVSLAVGVAGAVWVKAVNTLDSMLGYPAKPHGTASARLDDAAMWLPARLGALCLAVAAADPGALRRAPRWARAPPSPNSGWPMATLAAVLDRRLEKPGVYALGDGTLPSADDARRGVRVADRAAVLGVALAGVGAWL